MADPRPSFTYCSAELRAHDPERFLTSLFAADEDRPALHALYALNLELARVAGSVSEPILGQIRLQWWREAIDGIYAGTPRQHQVVLALEPAIRERGLPREPFEALISGRELELEDEPPATLDELEAYLDATNGTLVALGLHALGAKEGDAVLETGRAVGIASGYATVLKALRTEAGRRRPLIPRDVLARHSVTTQDIAFGQSSQGLAKAVEEIADRARSRLAAAKQADARPSRRHMSPLLSASLVPSYLKALKAADHDPFAVNYERGALGRHLRVFAKATLRRI